MTYLDERPDAEADRRAFLTGVLSIGFVFGAGVLFGAAVGRAVGSWH